MNTERPDNDAAGAAEERGDVEEQAAVGADASDGADAGPGAPDGERGVAGGLDGGTPDRGTPDRGTAGGGTAGGEAPAAERDGAVSGAEAAEGDEGDEGDEATVSAARARDADAGSGSGSAEAPAPRTAPALVEVPGPHETDGPHPRRRRSPVLIASVAAAVLLVGGGGAYLAASASGGGGRTGSGASGDGTSPPPLALDGYSEGGTSGIAPGEPNPYGTTYEAAGTLPDGPDSAPVYRATSEVTKDRVARLAKALGLDGTPVAQGQAWQVGPDKDGSGPSLVVNRQAPGTWTFHRYAAGTDDCRSVTACTKDPADPAGDPVSEAAAKKAAAPVLKAVGQDDAKVDASQVMGAQRAVNADPVVGGLPTYGWTTGLTVSAQGQVVGGSGQLTAPAEGDTYPVVSARKALDLLNAAPAADHRMGIGGCASPVPLKDRLEAPCGQSAPDATATPARQSATVEHAVFGLASHSVDGRPALVPSWLFEVRAPGAQDTFTVTYPAVDPRYLASNSPSARPTPSAGTPTPAPATRDIKVDGYTADGRDLTVTFTGGVCGDYDAKASETADQVTVTVTETPWKDKVCIMIAKEMVRTVRLDQPLGDRKVVGSDGKEIPQVKPGARLPRTPAGTQ